VIELTGVSRRYESGHLAVCDVDLEVQANEIVAVIGPSGCGKSTLLRLVAGLDLPTTGKVRVAGHQVRGPDRSVGIVFQQPRLMPWLDVAHNVAFGLQKAERSDDDVAEAIARVGLTDFATALPRELSGGMAQRTAIARALVTNPPVLLLDEPFNALDAFTRIDLQRHLLEVWSWYQPTMFLVTHDIDEALILADRILVLGGSPGNICASIEVDLDRPRSRSERGFHAFQDLAMSALGSVRFDEPVASG
jgi:sulfonate transport system ATP-binding protein